MRGENQALRDENQVRRHENLQLRDNNTSLRSENGHFRTTNEILLNENKKFSRENLEFQAREDQMRSMVIVLHSLLSRKVESGERSKLIVPEVAEVNSGKLDNDLAPANESFTTEDMDAEPHSKQNFE